MRRLRWPLTALAAALWAWSFTVPWLQVAGWFYPLPFVDAAYRLRGWRRWAALGLFYVVFWGVLVWWLRVYHPLALPSVLFGFGLYLSVWSVLALPVLDRWPAWRALLLPALVTGLEHFTSLGYLGFPWGPAAGGVVFRTALIQAADVGGTALVSFLVWLAAALVYEVLVSREVGRARRYAAAFGLLMLVWYGYGLVRTAVPSGRGEFKVGLVQAAIDPRMDRTPVRERLLDGLEEMTLRAVGEGAELVSWAESSVLEYIFHYLRYERFVTNYRADAAFGRRVLAVPVRAGVPVLTGLPEVEVLPDGAFRYYNSATLLLPEGRAWGRYDKIHLVPFGEWFPYGRLFPWVKRLLERLGGGDYTPGREYRLFPFRSWRFAVPICYEGVFGGHVRRFVLKGADFVVNITDDMWNYDRRAHWQHGLLGVFRAVENRVPFVRCGNSGLTCVVDPLGRMTAWIPVLRPGYLVAEVRFLRRPRRTLYTLWGDWVGWWALGLVLVGGVAVRLERLMRRGGQG